MASILQTIGAALLAGFSIIGLEPGKAYLNRFIYTLYPGTIPDIGTLIDMRFKGIISAEEYSNIAIQLGYTIEWSDKLYNSGNQLLSAVDIINAYRREFIDKEEMQDKLTNLRISDDDQTLLQQVTEYFPTPPDIIRFAVREVYTPKTREKYGMLLDIPEEYYDNASKAGLSKDQARNFWAAHWELPSTLQGFRMLHRNIIDEDDLKLLLKSLDVMPYWRDKIIQLSYNPLTRVDVRRMFALGVLDEDGILKAYKDIGYNDDNAKLMVDFTVKYVNDENKGITRSSIVSAYKKGAISIEDLVEYLTSMGYSDKVVKFWANYAQNDKVTNETDDLIGTLVIQYVNGAISKDKLENGLGLLNISDSYTQHIIAKADLKRRAKIKLPSKKDLQEWLKKGLIDEGIFNIYMTESGYRAEDISLYIKAAKAS